MDRRITLPRTIEGQQELLDKFYAGLAQKGCPVLSTALMLILANEQARFPTDTPPPPAPEPDAEDLPPPAEVATKACAEHAEWHRLLDPEQAEDCSFQAFTKVKHSCRSRVDALQRHHDACRRIILTVMFDYGDRWVRRLRGFRKMMDLTAAVPATDRGDILRFFREKGYPHSSIALASLAARGYTFPIDIKLWRRVIDAQESAITPRSATARKPV